MDRGARGPDDDADVPDAGGHIRRALVLTTWTEAGFVVTALGSVAGFVAQMGLDGTSSQSVPAEIFDGAQMLAVLVVTGTGTVLAERLRRRSRALASP